MIVVTIIIGGGGDVVCQSQRRFLLFVKILEKTVNKDNELI